MYITVFGRKPVYSRSLTLLSFHVLMRENVDAAIYEVGVGGEWDSTNVIEAQHREMLTSVFQILLSYLW